MEQGIDIALEDGEIEVDIQLDFLKGDKGDAGDKGDTGDKGDAGYTPVKGTDYYTEEEKQEITQNVTDAVNAIILTQEEERQINENARVTNELNREQAETEREETFTQMQIELETQVAELKNENKVLKKQIPTGQASGENITLNDSAGDIEFKKLEVCGNSIQDGTPTPESPIEIQNVNGSVNITINNGLESTDTNYQEQAFTFPLSEGQRMYKDSYLADDGVHHKRGQYQFTGNETILTDLELTNTRRYYNNLKVVNAKSTLAVSNRFVQADSATDLNNNDNQKILTLNGGQFAFRLNKTIANGVTELKSWLAENPVIVEYELAEEIIEPYTEEQQAVYNEIKKAISYKNITHIFSTDETSPIFEVTYRKDLESMFNQLTNTDTVQTMIDNSVGSVIGGEY